MPSLVTRLDQTHIFKWWVLRCRYKMDAMKTCFEEIGLCAQNLLTIEPDSVVNMIRGTYVAFLWLHKHLRSAPKVYGIEPDFFIYICSRTEISTLQTRVL